MENNGNAAAGRGYKTAESTETEWSEPMCRRGSMHIPTNEEEKHHVHEVHGRDSRRAKILEFLHSPKVIYTLMALLLLDVTILFVELFLGAMFPLCYQVVREAISCCPASLYFADSEEAHRFLAGDGSVAAAATCEAHPTNASSVEHRAFRYMEATGEDKAHGGESHRICEAGIDTPQCPAGCDEHKYHAVHTVEEVLFWCTITILTLFMVELILLIICLQPKVFFRKLFYVLDFFVVVTSLALELTFHFLHEDIVQSLVGLIVLFRLWRFVRIGHGIVEVTHEYAARKHDKLVSYANKLEDLLIENDIPLPPRKNIEKLKRLDTDPH